MAGSNILTRKQLEKMINEQLIDFAMKLQDNLISKQTYSQVPNNRPPPPPPRLLIFWNFSTREISIPTHPFINFEKFFFFQKTAMFSIFYLTYST